MAKVMAFIDGENLTLRFEAMVKEGRKPRISTPQGALLARFNQQKNSLVWSPHTFQDIHFDDVIERAQYYTTYSGAEDQMEVFSDTVGKCFAHESQVGNIIRPPRQSIRLIPRIFKKTKTGTKTKSVDINICVDVLECVKSNMVDAIYLVSGDIDYRPLIEAVMRAGKRVYVASLSSGRSPLLQNIPDRFVDLDELYFYPPVD